NPDRRTRDALSGCATSIERDGAGRWWGCDSRRHLAPILPRMGSAKRSRMRAGLVVALDGPASSGKSSVGAAAATRLGYRFCDTGLLYRAITWLAMHRGLRAEHVDALVRLVPEIELLDD